MLDSERTKPTPPKEKPLDAPQIFGIIADAEDLYTAYSRVAVSHEFGGATATEADMGLLDRLRQQYTDEFNDQLRVTSLGRDRAVAEIGARCQVTTNEGGLTISSSRINFLGQAFPCIADAMGLAIDRDSLSGKKPYTDFAESSQQETETWRGTLPSGQPVTAQVLHLLRGTQRTNPDSLRYLQTITVEPAPTTS